MKVGSIMAKRVERVQALLKNLNVDGVLIKSKTVKKYLDTLTGSGCKILITREKGYLILDGRYITEAKEKEKDLEIVLSDSGGYLKSVKEILDKHNYNSLAVEGNSMLIDEYIKIKETIDKVHILKDELNMLRIIKEKEEIAVIKEACKLTDEIFYKVIDKIKIGMNEHEISALIQYYGISMGASRMSFETIVATGKRSAMPHGRPTERKIKAHEPILLDFGIEYKNYQSDMTRTVFIGEPTDKMRDVYEVVLKAQTSGVKRIKTGTKAKEVDKIARDIIKNHGYGEYFNHGLGHGIGIGDGEEYPILNEKSDTVLEEGMIMSCEPGIYIPDLGGVRIEDDVLIENGVGVPLNHASKELLVLKEK
jgi:Xaa-Pro aminopeptidase